MNDDEIKRAYSLIGRARVRARWRKEAHVEVRKICLNCGKLFSRIVRKSFASRVRYCSRKCCNAAYLRRKRLSEIKSNEEETAD